MAADDRRVTPKDSARRSRLKGRTVAKVVSDKPGGKVRDSLRQPLRQILDLGQLWSFGRGGPAPEPAAGPSRPLLPDGSDRSDRPLKALCVLDDISEASWRGSFRLEKLRRKSFADQIAGSNADFAFMESCWKGGGGRWAHAFTSPDLSHSNARALVEAIGLVRQRGLPLVFWNKEDPMHFDRFLPIARMATSVLTTDSNKVDAYRREMPGAFVGALSFGANPALTNPSNRFRTDSETVCFAGAYYPEFHEERNRQMDFVLPAVERFDGAIYDRYSHLETDRYRFPERYAPYIRPSVAFRELVKLYKRFKVFLNVNTIVDSPTMMARRVYELLASGTPVVSAPSAALAEQFPGIVAVGETEQEIQSAVEKLLIDADHWDRVSHLGYREVLGRHTYGSRAAIVEAAVGGVSKPSRDAPLVSIVVPSCRPRNIDRMIDNIAGQSYPNVEVIFALTPNFTATDRERLEGIGLRSPNLIRSKVLVFGEDVTLGECLNHAVRESRGEYIAKIDDDNFYFAHYLSDLMLAFQIGDFDVVGKESHFCFLGGRGQLVLRVPNKRHCGTGFVCGDAMIMRRRVFQKTSFPAKRSGEDTKLLNDVVALGGSIYAADHFNFIKVRTGNLDDHTWKVEENELMRNATVVADSLDFAKAIA